MSIAINIITTNDEMLLEKALYSVKDLNPEYVIGYTGDINAEEYNICKKYAPNSTYIIKWENDFSKARNFLIEKTKSDWIISLDSDEEFTEKSIKRIKEILKNPKGMYHQFKVIHGLSITGQIRMFYNHENIRYSYAIHERIIPNVYPTNHSDIEIIHNMYKPERSSDRNIKILEQELKGNPNHPDYNFYIAIEYHLIGKNMKALIHAEKFLQFYSIKTVDVKKMYMRYLIAWICVHSLKNIQKAIEIICAQLILNCNIAEFWCLLGDAYFRLKRYNQAKIFYSNAITMGEYKYDNMWLVDTTKYKYYPEKRIELCNKIMQVDLDEFNLEIQSPILP